MTDSSTMMISAGYHECQEIRWRSPWCWWLTPQPWWSQLTTMSAKRSDEDLSGVDDWLLNHDDLDLSWLPWVPRDQMKISLVLMTDSSTMMISAGYHECQEIRWKSPWCWWLTPQPWWSQLATISAKRSDENLPGVDDWLLNNDDLSWLPWVPRDQMKISLVLMTDSSTMMILISAGYHECQEIRWRSPWCW